MTMTTEASNPFDGLGSAAAKAVEQNAGPPPSDKQVKFYTDLLVRKGGCDEAEIERRVEKRKAEGGWTKTSVSKAIDDMLKMPDKPGAEAPGAVKEGMYRLEDGTVIKVYVTVHGAKQLVGSELRVERVGFDEAKQRDIYEHEFVYLGKKGLTLAARGTRLTQEEAKKLGQLYGFCVRCGLTLTLEESQYVGYGATCAGHEGWWYPTRAELKALTAHDHDITKAES